MSTGSDAIHDVIDESSTTTSSPYRSDVSTASRDVIGRAVSGRQCACTQGIGADRQFDVERPRTDALPVESTSGGVKGRQSVHRTAVPTRAAHQL